MDRGSGAEEYATIVPDSPETFPDPGYRGRENVSQEYYFLTLDPSSLISLNYPVRVAPLVNWKSSSFLRVYRVDSRVMRSSAAPRRVTAQPAMAAPMLAFYTRAGDDEQIRSLALQVTKGESGYFAKAAAVEAYLKTNYLYSLKPGIAEDGNQLHHFLFVSRKGYCSYFAFAMALMCRSLGIPARVAVGFYVDPQSEVLNFYEVRAFQAHAWVEVYFGDLGWVEFDPTSQTLAPGEEFTPFPGPDRDMMAKLIAEIVKNQTAQEEQAEPAPRAVGTASMIGREIARIALLVARLWYITLPALYALFLFCAKLLPSLPGLLSRRPRRRMKALYALCVVQLTGAGYGRRPGESPLEHAQRVRADRKIELEPVVESYLKASFAERFDSGDAREARARQKAFTVSWRSRMPVARRILGILNPIGALARRS
jgi:transglutaminase-like putative cysteine protease